MLHVVIIDRPREGETLAFFSRRIQHCLGRCKMHAEMFHVVIIVGTNGGGSSRIFSRRIQLCPPNHTTSSTKNTLREGETLAFFLRDVCSIALDAAKQQHFFYRFGTFLGSFWGHFGALGALRGCREAMKERKRAAGQPREAPKGSMEAPMGPSRGAPEALWR